MKKINIIVIIGLLIAFGLGYGLNYIWGQKIEKYSMQCSESEKPLAKYLDSGVISSIDILGGGQIKEISGYSLTLEKEGKSFIIFVNNNTDFLTIVLPKEEGKSATREKINFEDIKVGDKVSVAGKLNADASLEINSVTVLPPWY